jgi:hypothetical protein
VDPAKTVVSEMQGQCRFQIIPLFREGVVQPGETLAPVIRP